MKILIITQYFYPESFRINDLAVGLIERGHKVKVLTGIPNYPKGNIFPGYRLFQIKRENYYGVQIIRSPLIPRRKGKSINLIMNYFSFALFASITALFRCREKYDIIFVFQPSPITVAIPAIILKKIKKIPIILWVQDLWPESLKATGAIKSSIIYTLIDKLVRFIYNNSNSILASSNGFIPQIVNMGVQIDKVDYFPNWAEEMYVTANTKNKNNSIKLPSGFKIMFAGNIGVAQDFNTILATAEKLRKNTNIHWIILGDGRMLDWLRNELVRRNLSSIVHLLGRHPIELMPMFFASADVMLLSLKGDPVFSLTIPSKLQSYMACARPVIAAIDGEGSKVIEKSGCGFSCPTEKPDELAKIILAMYRIPKRQRNNMGKQGRKYFNHNFDRNKLINQLENLMYKLNPHT